MYKCFSDILDRFMLMLLHCFSGMLPSQGSTAPGPAVQFKLGKICFACYWKTCVLWAEAQQLLIAYTIQTLLQDNRKKIYNPNAIKKELQTSKWSNLQWKLARVLQLNLLLMKSPWNLSGMLEPCSIIGLICQNMEFFLNLNMYSPIGFYFLLFSAGKKRRIHFCIS